MVTVLVDTLERVVKEGLYRKERGERKQRLGDQLV